ncbi:MAG: transposase [Thermodesulfobacteriota bacterium]|nr:transposase [Thermodesulfobacteriota bacterium]
MILEDYSRHEMRKEMISFLEDTVNLKSNLNNNVGDIYLFLWDWSINAYSGYDELFQKDGVIEVGRWVHARRKFDEEASSRPQEATEIMARIARLYKLEAECADMKPDDRTR